jgi:DNA-binding GntR family transcriptional regulator
MKLKREAMSDARPKDVLEPIPALYMRSLSEHAYGRIRAAILSGGYAPGRRLRERQLAGELGVSTTPIKEALKRLELEGLIVTAPRRGTFVRYSPETASEMALIRASLESAAARLAAMKITPAEAALLGDHLATMRLATRAEDHERVVESNAQFHQLICRIAGNAYLLQLLQTLKVYEELNRRRALRSHGEAELGLAEHAAILAALGARDPDLAERLMREHILRSAALADRVSVDEAAG